MAAMRVDLVHPLDVVVTGTTAGCSPGTWDAAGTAATLPLHRVMHTADQVVIQVPRAGGWPT